MPQSHRSIQFVLHKYTARQLGHILTSTLDDTADIMRVVKDINRKINSLLCLFHFVDPHVKTFLLQSYCLSLYGSCLWSLNAPSINLIEVALNKILRKIWRLPVCLMYFHLWLCISMQHAYLPRAHLIACYTLYVRCSTKYLYSYEVLVDVPCKKVCMDTTTIHM